MEASFLKEDIMKNAPALIASALLLALAAPRAGGVPINVAHLQGVASANSHYAGQSAALAIDDDDATYWVAPDHGTANDPNWLIIDLGGSFMVDAIDLDWQRPDGNYAGYTTVYSLFHGSSGSDWQLIGDGTFIDEDPTRISAHYAFDTGQSMRYVKYEVNGGSHWSGIAEIRVWADDDSPPGPLPEPSTLALLATGLLGLSVLVHRRGRARR
jgi:uncharacterized protein YceK